MPSGVGQFLPFSFPRGENWRHAFAIAKAVISDTNITIFWLQSSELAYEMNGVIPLNQRTMQLRT